MRTTIRSDGTATNTRVTLADGTVLNYVEKLAIEISPDEAVRAKVTLVLTPLALQNVETELFVEYHGKRYKLVEQA